MDIKALYAKVKWKDYFIHATDNMDQLNIV